jgi:hypothetical protein
VCASVPMMVRSSSSVGMMTEICIAMTHQTTGLSGLFGLSRLFGWINLAP